MFSKKFLLLMILLAAIGLPYLLSKGGLSTLKQKWNSMFGGESTADAPLASVDANTMGVANPGNGGAGVAQLTGPQVAELGEVFSFGVTPDWIMSRWTRVTTTVADLELDGMRVALSTGPRHDDVHGSLTYYFNKQLQLERITFRGFTGDASRLVRLVLEHYDFQQTAIGTGGMFLKRWNGKPKGVLFVELAPVIQTQNTRSGQKLTLEINNTLGRYELSREMTALLKSRGL